MEPRTEMSVAIQMTVIMMPPRFVVSGLSPWSRGRLRGPWVRALNRTRSPPHDSSTTATRGSARGAGRVPRPRGRRVARGKRRFAHVIDAPRRRWSVRQTDVPAGRSAGRTSGMTQPRSGHPALAGLGGILPELEELYRDVHAH